MKHDVQEDWLIRLPVHLQADALALIDCLAKIPSMKPEKCPWCMSLRIKQYPSDLRTLDCQACHHRCTPWTGTPFANCRHQNKWDL